MLVTLDPFVQYQFLEDPPLLSVTVDMGLYEEDDGAAEVAALRGKEGPIGRRSMQSDLHVVAARMEVLLSLDQKALVPEDLPKAFEEDLWSFDAMAASAGVLCQRSAFASRDLLASAMGAADHGFAARIGIIERLHCPACIEGWNILPSMLSAPAPLSQADGGIYLTGGVGTDLSTEEKTAEAEKSLDRWRTEIREGDMSVVIMPELERRSENIFLYCGIASGSLAPMRQQVPLKVGATGT